MPTVDFWFSKGSSTEQGWKQVVCGLFHWEGTGIDLQWLTSVFGAYPMVVRSLAVYDETSNYSAVRKNLWEVHNFQLHCDDCLDDGQRKVNLKGIA